MHDAIIVGCGPAGNTLAWRLAEHGFKALLLKDANFGAIWLDIVVLTVFALVTMAIATPLFKRSL